MRHPSGGSYEGDKGEEFKCDWVRSLDEVGIIYESRTSDGSSQTSPRKRCSKSRCNARASHRSRKPLNAGEIPGDIP